MSNRSSVSPGASNSRNPENGPPSTPPAGPRSRPTAPRRTRYSQGTAVPGGRTPSPHPRRHLPRRRLQAPGPHRARKPRDPPHPRPCRHPPPPAEAAPALPPLRRRPPPLCRPAQAGPARRHKTRRTARTPRPKPAKVSEPGHPTRPASRSPRIRRNGPLAPRSAPPPGRRRPHLSQSQTRTRRPAPRSKLRSHHSNKHGISLPSRCAPSLQRRLRLPRSSLLCGWAAFRGRSVRGPAGPPVPPGMGEPEARSAGEVPHQPAPGPHGDPAIRTLINRNSSPFRVFDDVPLLVPTIFPRRAGVAARRCFRGFGIPRARRLGTADFQVWVEMGPPSRALVANERAPQAGAGAKPPQGAAHPWARRAGSCRASGRTPARAQGPSAPAPDAVVEASTGRRPARASEPVRKLWSGPDSGICDVAGEYIGIRQAHSTSVRLLSERSLRRRYFARAARIGTAQ